MKFNVNEIPSTGLELEENISASDLDIETSDVKYEAPINVFARVIRDKNDIYVTVSIKGIMVQECARCVAKFQVPLKGRYEFVYSAKEQATVDLLEDIRQEIMLSYPVKTLCKPDCKGLCPVCGKDLNQGQCGCDRSLKKWDKK